MPSKRNKLRGASRKCLSCPKGTPKGEKCEHSRSPAQEHSRSPAQEAPPLSEKDTEAEKDYEKDGESVGLESNKNAERTFLAIKPDGVNRKLIGRIISRFEERGFKLVGLKMMRAERSLLEEHYEDLKTKPFFFDLMEYMEKGPIVAMVWEGTTQYMLLNGCCVCM